MSLGLNTEIQEGRRARHPLPPWNCSMIRCMVLAVISVALMLGTSVSRADSIDTAITNNKLVILDVIENHGSPELGGIIDVDRLRADLVPYLKDSFEKAGVAMTVLDRSGDLSSAQKTPPLTMLYVTLRIDVDIVNKDDGNPSLIGAAGVFFQKEGMAAHQSMQPLTLFTSTGIEGELNNHARKAAQEQLVKAVVEPIAYWSR